MGFIHRLLDRIFQIKIEKNIYNLASYKVKLYRADQGSCVIPGSERGPENTFFASLNCFDYRLNYSEPREHEIMDHYIDLCLLYPLV